MTITEFVNLWETILPSMFAAMVEMWLVGGVVGGCCWVGGGRTAGV